MEMFNAYEVLDELAEKSKMFGMIRNEFKVKDEKIEQLEQDNEAAMVAIAEVYETLLGGMQ